MSHGNSSYSTMFKMAGDQYITIPRAPCLWTLALAVEPFTEKHKLNPYLVLAEHPGNCGLYLQSKSRPMLVSVTHVFTCLLLLQAYYVPETDAVWYSKINNMAPATLNFAV